MATASRLFRRYLNKTNQNTIRFYSKLSEKSRPSNYPLSLKCAIAGGTVILYTIYKYQSIESVHASQPKIVSKCNNKLINNWNAFDFVLFSDWLLWAMSGNWLTRTKSNTSLSIFSLYQECTHFISKNKQISFFISFSNDKISIKTELVSNFRQFPKSF